MCRPERYGHAAQAVQPANSIQRSLLRRQIVARLAIICRRRGFLRPVFLPVSQAVSQLFYSTLTPSTRITTKCKTLLDSSVCDSSGRDYCTQEIKCETRG